MIFDRRRFLQSAAIVAGGSALGGALGPVPASALSRPGRCCLHPQADDGPESGIACSPVDTPAVVAEQQEWLVGYFDAMERHVMQQSSVNLPSRDLPDWKRAYHGDNLGRLSQVKLQYDPHEFFRFPQSVPLPTRVSARG